MEILTQPWTIELEDIMEMERRVVEVLANYKIKDEAINNFILQNRRQFLKHLMMRNDTTQEQREIIESYFMVRKLTNQKSLSSSW